MYARFLDECEKVRERYKWVGGDGDLRAFPGNLNPLWAVAGGKYDSDYLSYLTEEQKNAIVHAAHQCDHVNDKTVRPWDRWLRANMEERLHCRHPLIGEQDEMVGGLSYLRGNHTTYMRFYKSSEGEYIFCDGFRGRTVRSVRRDLWQLADEIDFDMKSVGK